MKKIILITIMISIFSIPGQLLAEDLIFCASVYPCNSDGSVQAPYNEGECAEYYSEMCEAEVETELKTCQIERDFYQEKYENTSKLGEAYNSLAEDYADSMAKLEKANKKLKRNKRLLRKLRSK